MQNFHKKTVLASIFFKVRDFIRKSDKCEVTEFWISVAQLGASPYPAATTLCKQWAH